LWFDLKDGFKILKDRKQWEFDELWFDLKHGFKILTGRIYIKLAKL